ncbi:MAG: LexA family protein [Metallibacterium sp.]
MTPPSTHGGRRPGAGRKPGSGSYGEPTQPLRVPQSQVPTVLAYLEHWRTGTALPLEPGTAVARDPQPLASSVGTTGPIRFSAAVPAGFPSPADDYVQECIDLNRHLIRQGHEAATFILRVEGWSMLGAGIHDGDEIVVDRALTPSEGRIVVAVVNGQLTIKRLRFREGQPVLIAENPHFADRTFAEGEELEIWGVVTRVLHKV